MQNKLKEKYNQLKLADKKLYLVASSDQFESEDEFLDAIASALEGGAGIVQLREKNKPARQIIELGRKIKQLCLQYDATFIINDRIDIAFLIEADGVHFEQDGLDVDSAREILGENVIVGVSTSMREQASKAVKDGADYIFVAPVFMDFASINEQKVENEYLKWASENIKIPVFAFGGIDLGNVQKVLDFKTIRVAVGESVINAKSPMELAEKFIKKL